VRHACLCCFSHREFFHVLGCVALLTICGCGGSDTAHPYGEIKGWHLLSSRNALGVHRRMWELKGVRCLTPRKLSNRLDQVDVIVLVSQEFAPPGPEARRWLEQWLRSNPGRTVIYFGRDFNANKFYYQQTRAHLTAQQQQLADLEIAGIETTEIQGRLESYTESNFCDWFYLDADRPEAVATQWTGPWVSELPSQAGWPLRTRLMPPDNRYKEKPPSWILALPEVNPLAPVDGESEESSEQEEPLIYRSLWQQDEVDTLEKWQQSFDQMLTAEVLLQSPDVGPLVFRLRDQQRLGQGQIIVVANGAPFLNASLVEPAFGQVAQQLIHQCLPAKRAAFISFGSSGLLVSNVDEADEREAGWEALTQWPISVITMSAAMLGLVVCAYLLPILGRPRQYPPRSVSDFGMHIDAIGQMLHESQDLQFAQQAVGNYFRDVRSEQPPAWLGDELSQTNQVAAAGGELTTQSPPARSTGLPTTVAKEVGIYLK
jgi:hypothetical protein